MSSQTADGDALFADVRTYFDFGVHRAGSSTDHATASWVAQRLASAGLTVESIPVPFSQWTPASTLHAGDTPIFHLPVPYEWEGSISTDNVAVLSVDPKYGGFPEVLGDAVAQASAGGAQAAVLCTEHANGSLVGINRTLGAPVSGFPTVLAAGRDLAALEAGPVRLEMSAETRPGKTSNVVGTWVPPGMDPATPPLLLTTPLTGWFGCAGERGTGIAVLLHLIERFKHVPLLVVATGGHELTWFGADAWVNEYSVDQYSVDQSGNTPRAVIHVGASVAVDEDDPDNGGRRLASTRLARTSVSAADAAPMIDALTAARLHLAADTTEWVGEGKTFCRINAPLLSFSGAGLDFHCPEDTPERATSPAALANAANAIATSVDVMVQLTQ